MSGRRLPRPSWRTQPESAAVPPWMEGVHQDAPAESLPAPVEPVVEPAAPVVPETAQPPVSVEQPYVAPGQELPTLRDAADRASGEPRGALDVGLLPPCSIQTRVSAEDALRMFEQVARSWTRVGETAPYGTGHERRAKPDGDDFAALLDAGHANIERLQATLRRNDVAADPTWAVLELGCGLGRNTRFLAEAFQRVFAVDVSSAHLRLARKLNADVPHIDRVAWLPLVHPKALASLPTFDLFFSVDVLQHNPPPVIALLLETAAEKLRPGGYAFFQLSTYQRWYAFDVDAYLALRGDETGIEMHVFPQAEVFRIFGERGCVLLEVFEDGLSGYRENHRSNTFLFHKPAQAPAAAADDVPPPNTFKSAAETS